MTRQRWPYFSLILGLGLISSACGSGADELDQGIGMVAPPPDAGSIGQVDAAPSTPLPNNPTPTFDAGTLNPNPSRPDTSVVAIVDSGIGATDSGPTTSPEGGTSSEGGTGNPGKPGDCCPDGGCLCHGPVAARLSGATKGPFKTATLRLSTGTVYYPTDAEPPFASVALCGGFLNTGPEMVDWGPFYASYGIVTIITTTGGFDFPEERAPKLLASIEELKKENAKSGSPLMGKLSDRYGTSGYSMGGGATTIASGKDATLKTSVGLASWGPVTNAVKVPTLLLCGTADTVAPCSGHTDPGYAQLPATTDKMKIVINGGDHLAAWFGPQDGGGGTSGGWALAFQKVYLEGDVRWKELLLSKPTNATVTTNIK